MKHLLSATQLSAEEITRILDTADSFREVGTRVIKKVPALRGRTVVNLFLENSTRTRISFEVAAKRLSADVINFSAGGDPDEDEVLGAAVALEDLVGDAGHRAADVGRAEDAGGGVRRHRAPRAGGRKETKRKPHPDGVEPRCLASCSLSFPASRDRT